MNIRFQFLKPDKIKRDKLRKIFRKDYDNNGILERMVKFDRKAIQEILEPGEQILALTGKVFYNAGSTDFEGKNIIRVTEKK